MSAKYRWFLFILFAAAYFAVFVQRLGLGAIGGYVQQTYELSHSAYASIGAISFMVYAVAILFAGFVATSLGPRKTMAIFFTIAGLGVLVFARVPDFTALRIGAGMIGLGAAVVVTSATVIFSRWFSMKEYSKVTAMFFVAGGIGTMGGTGSAHRAYQNL